MALGRAAIVGTLLAPDVLAFFSGGYFERPRLWALGIAGLLVALAAVVGRQPWPRTATGWLAVGGLAGLTAWTALSITWSPVRDVAQGDAQRLALYLAILLAGAAALRDRSAARAVEPALALGALLVVLEGLSERLLPGLFSLATSTAAHSRLAQPLTYWNAMALLAGIGGVLCARGWPATRPGGARCASPAAPGCADLRGRRLPPAVARRRPGGARRPGARLRCSSRTRTQLRALAVAPRLLPAPRRGPSPQRPPSSVRALDGTQGTPREQEGAVNARPARRGRGGSRRALGGVALVQSPSANGDPWPTGVRARPGGAWRRPGRHRRALRAERHPDPRRRRQPAPGRDEPASDEHRIQPVELWRVARHAFAAHPVAGVGSGGFQTEWLHRRTIPYAARDAHSLYFETAAELGVVGLLLLGGWLAGAALCGRQVWRRDPALAAGLIAICGMWAVHAGLDWHWEMPGVTLFALVPAAALVALGDRRERAPVAEPVRTAPTPALEVDEGVAL